MDIVLEKERRPLVETGADVDQDHRYGDYPNLIALATFVSPGRILARHFFRLDELAEAR